MTISTPSRLSQLCIRCAGMIVIVLVTRQLTGIAQGPDAGREQGDIAVRDRFEVVNMRGEAVAAFTVDEKASQLEVRGAKMTVRLRGGELVIATPSGEQVLQLSAKDGGNAELLVRGIDGKEQVRLAATAEQSLLSVSGPDRRLDVSGTDVRLTRPSKDGEQVPLLLEVDAKGGPQCVLTDGGRTTRLGTDGVTFAEIKREATPLVSLTSPVGGWPRMILLEPGNYRRSIIMGGSPGGGALQLWAYWADVPVLEAGALTKDKGVVAVKNEPASHDWLLIPWTRNPLDN